MSKLKVRVSKVQIDINGKKFGLSIEEAKQLKNILVEFFEDNKSNEGQKTLEALRGMKIEFEKRSKPVPMPAPYYIPYYIPETWPRRTWGYDPWRITYSSDDTSDSSNILCLAHQGG